MTANTFEVAIIGCGSAGLATAYFLAKHHRVSNIALIDCDQPMSFTSAQSGENYRNWWPHPTMVDFTNRSIDLMEDIARETGNRINMNRRGYALATRKSNTDDWIKQLHKGMANDAERLIRLHDSSEAASYQRPDSPNWDDAPDGVDILSNQTLIRHTFPSYASDVQSVIHIRRGGDISAQQLGMHMLEFLKEQGASRIRGTVRGIQACEPISLDIQNNDGSTSITAHKMVNAAGPFALEIARMLDVELPAYNTFQQKIAFEDVAHAIPRNMPFSIDLDDQDIDWQDDERAILLEDSDYRWLAQTMPGAMHCRPDGGDKGAWVKLGWAYNTQAAKASRDLPLHDYFPEVVLRGASRLNPSLKTYIGQLPRNMHHYGGWYTLTPENWPLIGPMDIDQKPETAFMNCALSGFGTMAACAAGELCAAWVAGAELPSYAQTLSIERLRDKRLMNSLREADKGIL